MMNHTRIECARAFLSLVAHRLWNILCARAKVCAAGITCTIQRREFYWSDSRNPSQHFRASWRKWPCCAPHMAFSGSLFWTQSNCYSRWINVILATGRAADVAYANERSVILITFRRSSTHDRTDISIDSNACVDEMGCDMTLCVPDNTIMVTPNQVTG